MSIPLTGTWFPTTPTVGNPPLGVGTLYPATWQPQEMFNAEWLWKTLTMTASATIVLNGFGFGAEPFTFTQDFNVTATVTPNAITNASGLLSAGIGSGGRTFTATNAQTISMGDTSPFIFPTVLTASFAVSGLILLPNGNYTKQIQVSLAANSTNWDHSVGASINQTPTVEDGEDSGDILTPLGSFSILGKSVSMTQHQFPAAAATMTVSNVVMSLDIAERLALDF